MLKCFLLRLRRPYLLVAGAVMVLMIASVSTSAAAPATNLSGASGLAQRAAAGSQLRPIGTPTPLRLFTTVPDCHYLSQLACQSLLISSDLKLGSVSFGVPQWAPQYIGSEVVSQSPAAGSIVLVGTAVNITVEPVVRPIPPLF